MKNDLLRKAREERGWTQRILAKEIDVEEQTVSSWERGIRAPSVELRIRLATVLGKPLTELGLELPSRAYVHTTSAQTVSAALYDPAIPPMGFPVGRDTLLQTLKAQMQQGDPGGKFALHGLPGVGKTMLASILAHDNDIRNVFSDGMLWAGLGPTPNITGLLSHWGTLLGVSSDQMATIQNNESWAITLCTTIGARKMLLIIDDAWKLEDVQSFQVGGPNCTYLMTTRSLDIALQFAPAEQIKVEELNEDESMRLLSLLAPEVTKREPSDTQALVRSVGGLPLALTLIGKYLHLQEYNGPPRRTRSALERLLHVEERLRLRQSIAPLERSTGMPPSISLQATIEISVQQLSIQGSEALRALAVFPAKPNTFSEDVAMMVCGDAAEVFDELSDAGLLERRRPDRYTLHQVISDYAHTTLKDTTVYDRLIAYYRHVVTSWPAAYEILEQESNNILAAVEAAYEFGREAELVIIIEAFAPFLLSRGLYEVAEIQLDRANKAAMVLGDNTRASILLYQGQVAQKQGHYALAEVTFQTGLTRAQQGDDPSLITSFLADLGWVTWKQGNYNHAEGYLQEGLALARQIGNKEQMSNILKVLGSVKASFGDYEASKMYHLEGLELARQIGDRGRICVLLINLGATDFWCGDYLRAKEYLQKGLVLAQQIGHYEWISLALLNLSATYLVQRHYKDAQSFAQEGLELARQIRHREWIGSHLTNLGIIARENGHYAQSETYLQESLDLMQQIGRPSVIAEVLYEYATLRLVMQQAEAAEDLLQQMKEVIPDGDRPVLALWQYGIAQLAALRGKRDEARQRAETSRNLLANMGSFHIDEVDAFLATLADSSSTHL